MVAAYSVTPESLSSAREVIARAASVQKFRQSFKPPQAPIIIPITRRQIPLLEMVKWPEWVSGDIGDTRETREKTGSIKVREIQQATCAYFQINMNDFLSPRRQKSVCLPRQIAMWLSKQATKLSLPQIGRKFDGRDHTTILSGIRRIERLRASGDQTVIQAIEYLSAEFNISA